MTIESIGKRLLKHAEMRLRDQDWKALKFDNASMLLPREQLASLSFHPFQQTV